MINFNFFGRRRNKFLKRSREAVENKEQKLNVGGTNASFGSGSGRHDELSDAELGEVKAGMSTISGELKEQNIGTISEDSSELNDNELGEIKAGYPGSADVREEMEQRQRDIIGSSELNDEELGKVTGGMRR